MIIKEVCLLTPLWYGPVAIAIIRRYFIYSAAVVARFDPAWAKRYNEKVLVLIRDIANPRCGPGQRTIPWLANGTVAGYLFVSLFYVDMCVCALILTNSEKTGVAFKNQAFHVSFFQV